MPFWNSAVDKLHVAVVHDWLVDYAGSERVLEQILQLFPRAQIFAVIDFLPPEARSFIRHKSVITTYIQHLPWAQRYYRSYLPLMPLAIEQLDLSEFDLVISSSHAVAKGVLTGPDQLHICYVHSPMRYAWDLQHQYLKEARLDRGIQSWVVRWLLHQLRLWDVRSSLGVDRFLANSRFIARRIQKVYRRSAKVIYPPVAVENFPVYLGERGDFYLTVSRLVPYKKVDLLVQAFALRPDRKLVVIGDGPEAPRIRALLGKNTEWLGFQPTAVVRDYMQRAKAFLYAAEEDFGITPLEALSCGTPVIAWGKGGLCETIAPSTGILFPKQSLHSLINALDQFERTTFDPWVCHDHAQQFSADRFRQAFVTTVEHHWKKFLAAPRSQGTF